MKPINNYIIAKKIKETQSSTNGLILSTNEEAIIRVEVVEAEDFQKGDKLIIEPKFFPFSENGEQYLIINKDSVLVKL